MFQTFLTRRTSSSHSFVLRLHNTKIQIPNPQICTTTLAIEKPKLTALLVQTSWKSTTPSKLPCIFPAVAPQLHPHKSCSPFFASLYAVVIPSQIIPCTTSSAIPNFVLASWTLFAALTDTRYATNVQRPRKDVMTAMAKRRMEDHNCVCRDQGPRGEVETGVGRRTLWDTMKEWSVKPSRTVIAMARNVVNARKTRRM